MFRFGSLGAIALGGFAPLVADGIAASLDINFVTNKSFLNGTVSTAAALLTTTRAQTNATATNLLPTSPSGFSYASYAANAIRIDGNGLLAEEQRTNRLLNSAAPVTQTTASLATGTYILWVNGSGSATSSAGTATITGAGTATQGSPNIFAVTVAGTVTVTVSGSLNAFQLEASVSTAGFQGTSLIVTAGAIGTRGGDIVSATMSIGGSATLYAQGVPNSPTASTIAQAVAYITDGTTANRFGLTRTAATGTLTSQDFLSSSNIYNAVSAGTWTAGASAKSAMAQQNGRVQACFNATLLTGGTPATTPSALTTITFGSFNNGTNFDGYVQRVAVWPSTSISNAGLQALTT